MPCPPTSPGPGHLPGLGDRPSPFIGPHRLDQRLTITTSLPSIRRFPVHASHPTVVGPKNPTSLHDGHRHTLSTVPTNDSASSTGTPAERASATDNHSSRPHPHSEHLDRTALVKPFGLMPLPPTGPTPPPERSEANPLGPKAQVPCTAPTTEPGCPHPEMRL